VLEVFYLFATKLFATKEPTYTVMMTSMYITLNEVSEGLTKKLYKENGRIKASLKYSIPFYNHFKYSDIINNNNNQQHFLLSVEDKLGIMRWSLRQFTCSLAVKK
jgi:hypothetical protein